jgi:hypothetical protein
MCEKKKELDMGVKKKKPISHFTDQQLLDVTNNETNNMSKRNFKRQQKIRMFRVYYFGLYTVVDFITHKHH